MNTHRPLDRPGPLVLYPSWSPPRSGLHRLMFGWLKGAPVPVGHLTIDEEAIRLTMAQVGVLGSVRWDRPFAMVVSRWAYADGSGTEVALGLRQRDVPPGAAWLQLRVLWPTERVPQGLPVKREQFAFIDPAAFPSLWAWLADCAKAHGIDWPRFDLDASEEELAGLESEGEMASCAACDSYAVHHVASGVYRCNSCGYEGGDGLAGLLAERRRHAFDHMSPQQRFASLDEDLTDAQRLIGSIVGVSAVISGYRNRDEQEMAAMVSLFGKVLEARGHLQDAAYKWRRRRVALDELIARLAFIDDEELSRRLEAASAMSFSHLAEQITEQRDELQRAMVLGEFG